MMPFDPRGGAEGERKEEIFWHHIHISSAAAIAAIDWAHARSRRGVVPRPRERGRRALNLVNVCAVQVCRAGERDGMLTRRGPRGKRRNLKAKWRERDGMSACQTVGGRRRCSSGSTQQTMKKSSANDRAKCHTPPRLLNSVIRAEGGERKCFRKCDMNNSYIAGKIHIACACVPACIRWLALSSANCVY